MGKGDIVAASCVGGERTLCSLAHAVRNGFDWIVMFLINVLCDGVFAPEIGNLATKHPLRFWGCLGFGFVFCVNLCLGGDADHQF